MSFSSTAPGAVPKYIRERMVRRYDAEIGIQHCQGLVSGSHDGLCVSVGLLHGCIELLDQAYIYKYDHETIDAVLHRPIGPDPHLKPPPIRRLNLPHPHLQGPENCPEFAREMPISQADRKIDDGPSHITRLKVDDGPDGVGESPDPEVVIKEEYCDLSALQEVLQIVIDLREIFYLSLVFGIDGDEFLV